MKIKRLEIVGFKSFVNPTIVDFDAPITGVVGPNGCGKSNVIDAIRWVMGEMSPKSLRGRSMEDVIFNGSEKRQPLGMAEVTLTFSTEDGIIPPQYAGFTEISITRRLYRSGDSEYLINKVPSRLHDIVDLFLGTGVGHKAYSIIEQGKIDFVISSKPEDRRLLLEEAAGISKFKSRKEAALRKMDGTEQNLVRLRDIFNEVTRQIASLDRQVKKAEKYKILKNDLREIELKLSARKFNDGAAALRDLRGQLESFAAQETESTAQVNTWENDLEAGRLVLTEKERHLNALQEKNFEITGRLRLLEQQDGFWHQEAHSLQQQIDQATREVEEIKGRLVAIEQEKESQEQRQLSLEMDFGNSATLLESTEKEWQTLEKKREELASHTDKLKIESQQNQAETIRLDAEKRLYEDRCVSLRGQAAKIGVEKEDLEKRIAEQRLSIDQKKQVSQESSLKYQCLKTEQSNLQSKRFELQERRDILNQELSIHKEELVNKRSRLKSLQDLERNFEGYEEGVRSILKASKEKGQESGVFGVVAQMIETGPQYEAAVGAVLGEKLQYVIIDSHDKGIEAINYLKSQGSGRGSFIPMTVRNSAVSHMYHDREGILGSLIEKIKVKDGYQKLAQFLLGDTVLVDSLSRALDIWHTTHPEKTLVTLDGEVVDPSGVVSGGTTGIQGKMLLEKKREIREILEVVGEMENDIGMKEDSVSQLEGSLSEIVMTLEQTSKEAREEEMRCMTLDKEVVHASSELDRLERERAKYQSQLDQLDQDIEKTSPFFTDYESRRQFLVQNFQEKEEAVRLLESDLRNLAIATRQIYDRLTNLRIEAAAVAERKNMAGLELNRLQKAYTETQNRLEERTTAITTANQKIAALRQNIETGGAEKDVLRTAAQEVSVQQEEARLLCDTLTVSLREKDEALKEARRLNDLHKTKTADLRVTLSKLETEFEYLLQQIFERYTVVLSEYAPTCDPEILAAVNVPEEDAKAQELKEKIARMGEVNLGSIEEYDELKKRETFLAQQIQDLETSLEALKKAIQKINLTTRKRFEETFLLVNERFQTLFPRLFQGGRAEMRLTDENDLLNSGVELLVQPRGKKLSHVGLLSGGEKALSALAFVFSIFLVKPSPFCILDEVDAPLDDANAERYHHLLSEMVSRTQFILITHNRTTMERCDQLYGVTMQEPGCSQLVSVKLSDGLKLAS